MKGGALYQIWRRPPPRATLTQDLSGRLQAYRTAQVRARVEGVVEKRLFQEGSDIKAGASLFHATLWRALALSDGMREAFD